MEKSFIDEVKDFIKNNNMDDVFVEKDIFFELYNCNIYVYLRVSTDDQNFGRELLEIYEWLKNKGIKVCVYNIYCDKCTAKKLNRQEYSKIRDLVVQNDYIVFSNLNRMGRGKPDEGYEKIKNEWYYYKSIGVNLLITEKELNEYISSPLPNEPKELTLNRQYLQDLLLINLMYKDCLKLIEVSTTTKDGLMVARSKGKQLGRPTTKNTTKDNLIKTLKLIYKKDYSIQKALAKTRYPRTSFFLKLKDYKKKLNTEDLGVIIKQLEKGEII